MQLSWLHSLLAYIKDWVPSAALPKLCMVARTRNLSTLVKAEELEVQGHPQLNSKFETSLD